MFAVIFKATIQSLDEEYSMMAKHMRDLAINEYGCTAFTACSEGDQEIAISYWPSKAHIQAWKNDPEHQRAQAIGKERWYRSYSVEIVEVLHQYHSA
jgi:heme-degrading monooxygenase HmoA